MTRFENEFAMREQAKAFLLERGFLPVVEFWLAGYGPADVVGGKFGPRTGRRVPDLLEVVAIELKLDDVAGVVAQAVRNRVHADWSFAAMPAERVAKMRPTTLELFTINQIGLLAFGERVVEIIAPIHNNSRRLFKSRQLWRRLKQAKSV